MIGGNLITFFKVGCLIGYPLDGSRSKESSLTTQLCFATSKSSWLVRASLDDRADYMFSPCPCETLQTRGYNSYTSTCSSGMGGRDICDSCDVFDVTLTIIISFSCSSFSQFSFCAANSLARVASYCCCWASSLLAKSASDYSLCASSSCY